MSQTNPGYDPVYFAPLAAAEDRHFWFKTRNQIIAAAAQPVVSQLEAGYRVLEVGCGTGNVLRSLAGLPGAGLVAGMDLYRDGLRFAHQRCNCPLVQADLRQPPFGAPFHLVGMFDVLEHLEDDRRVLELLKKLILPGGWLLLTVPASRRLWSVFDEAGGHVRRYERADLSALLASAGFKVEYLTYAMLTLYLPVWLARRTANLRRPAGAVDSQALHEEALDEIRVIPVINEIAAASMAWEVGAIRRRKQLPFGTSLLALAKI